MRSFIALAIVIAVAACSGNKNESGPSQGAAASNASAAARTAPPPAAKTAEAQPAAAKLAGDCVAIPPGDDSESADVDGDGITDKLRENANAHCDKYDCPRTVYVMRGACGHAVGTISVGFGSTLEPQTTRTNGLRDLVVNGLGGTTTYTFDGTQYIAAKDQRAMIGKPTPGTANDPRLIAANLENAIAHPPVDTAFVTSLFAAKVALRHCGKRKGSRDSVVQWFTTGTIFGWPEKRTCDGSCCTFGEPTQQDIMRAGNLFVRKLCAENNEITRLEVDCDEEDGE